ncbi:hypothetical protein V1523DRAFT_421822 [Lipomyces doorenjongii]
MVFDVYTIGYMVSLSWPSASALIGLIQGGCLTADDCYKPSLSRLVQNSEFTITCIGGLLLTIDFALYID